MNELEQVIEEYRAACKAYRQAVQNLNWAEPEFIDLAVADLAVADMAGAEYRINQSVKRIKLLKGVGRVA